MRKIESEFVKSQYKSGVKSYTDFTKKVGLWESEKYVFQRYIKETDKILDLGCGTGRTTFPLYKMGYNNIIGVDLTPEMITEAHALNKHFGLNVDFSVGNALELEFADDSFDSLIFSFNGLMSIPKLSNRIQAVKEIYRVLRKEGIFIFTTHDRAQEEQFHKFWEEERQRWDQNNQNPLLHEYGDLITESKNESREIFIHIPDQTEVNDLLLKNGFEVMETFYRNEKYNESQMVKSKSGECRFWVARKNSNFS